MDDLKKVVWQEGMFIAPQHFQQQDRYFQNYVRQNVETLSEFSPFYGVTELVINHDLLKVGKLSIAKSSGVFPDGTHFDMKNEIVRDIAQGNVENLVYLALPVALQGNNDYGQESFERSRYLTSPVDIFDAASLESASVEIEVANLNIVIKLEGEDTSGFTLIPIAKILEYTDSSEVILDHNFIPTCLHYGASELLVKRLKEIHALTVNRATNLLQRIQAGQETKSPQAMMQDYLWLQTVNNWLPWLDLTMANTKLKPHQLYVELRRFEAQVMSLIPETPPQCRPLQYHRMYESFYPLFSSLRNKLTLAHHDSVLEFAWNSTLFEKRRLMRTFLPDIEGVEKRRFVLSVRAHINSRELRELFPLAAKLSGNSRIAEIVRNGLSGIELNPLSVAPIELKPSPGAAYFEIDVMSRIWQSMLENRDALALHVDTRINELEIMLYALR